MNEPDLTQPILQPSDVLAIKPSITGIVVTVSCRQCRSQFEKSQSTIDAMAFGRYTCPNCETDYNLWPEDFLKALNNFFPHCTRVELMQIKKEASRIACSWYQAKPLAAALMYKGVNLGEPTERVLLSYILNGIFQAYLMNQQKT